MNKQEMKDLVTKAHHELFNLTTPLLWIVIFLKTL